MKNKKTVNVFIVILITFSLISITVKINEYKQRGSFTQEKWFKEPDKRYLIVKDMLKKHDFANMTKEQVINLLGEPDDAREAGGMPIGTYDSGKTVNLLNNGNSICFFTKTGGFPEEFKGFYLMFDNNGKVIDYAMIHFTT
jgi:hypothetical protein